MADTTYPDIAILQGAQQAQALVIAKEVTVTESTGAGIYTGSVTVPAGAYLLDVVVHAVALWDTTTSATGKVGDVADDDGIFIGIDLKATDLLAGEGISAAGVAGGAGGKAGADLVNSQWNRRYLATSRIVSLIVTAVGAAGTLGRTRMIVVYVLPSPVTAATKV